MFGDVISIKMLGKPAIGKTLHAEQELDNAGNKFAVKVVKNNETVNHLGALVLYSFHVNFFPLRDCGNASFTFISYSVVFTAGVQDCGSISSTLISYSYFSNFDHY